MNPEMAAGLERYLTDTPGIGGRLRKFAEDFGVEERSLLPPSIEDGEYTIARVTARNWETNRLMMVLSRRLGIPPYDITFAGTKDKRAVTTQLLCFRAPRESVMELDLERVEIDNTYTTDTRLEMGNLLGNSFDLIVRDIRESTKEMEKRVSATRAQLEEAGGFPNYFGMQRFGVMRPVTHIVGRHMVRGEFEEAVMTYVANPIAGELPHILKARSILQRTQDFDRAKDTYPGELMFERRMIQRMAKKPDDWLGALRTLPMNLLSMFIHAYQSYMFNRVVSKRMEMGLSLSEPLEGDVFLLPDENGLPNQLKYMQVTSINIPKISQMVGKRKAFISGVLFGLESELAGGIQGEIEAKIIEEEGVKANQFVIPEVPVLTSRGRRRPLLGPVMDLDIQHDDDTVRMCFSLEKGNYATSFMREFMKTNPLNY